MNVFYFSYLVRGGVMDGLVDDTCVEDVIGYLY